MSRIHQLGDSTSQLLDSGQHIIDTASVVKELIDNSLDAGATSIDVDVSSNVIDLIQVKDNGHGVRPADVNLLARKACTSKISQYDDIALLGGRYLGFRGMALNSIARLGGSMEIFTRVDTEPAGLRLHFSQNGEITRRIPQSGNPGTTVKITDFLKALPVRRQAVTKEYTKQLKKIKLMVQTYALARSGVKFCYSVHEAQQCTVIEAARNAFGSEIISDCTLRYWSSTLGFVEREEPDLHIAEEEHYAITALLLKPDIRFAKRHENDQYCSIDFRPIVSTRGTMKKIVGIYRRYLQQCLHGEIKNPFLCLNIMCPAGSYDPNIEPAKTDVLFAAEDQVLEIAEKFFQAVYNEAIEDHAGHQTPINQGSSMIPPMARPKPLVLLSQVSNSTYVSDFSSDLDLDEIVQLEEVEIQQEINQTSPSPVFADGQPFIDISTLSPSIPEDTSHSADASQALTEAEDRSQPMFRNPFEAAEMNAAWNRIRAERAQEFSDNTSNVSFGERAQSLIGSTNISIPSYRFGTPRENPLISGPPVSNKTVNGSTGIYDRFAPHASTSKSTKTTVNHGPLDTYFRPFAPRPVLNPPTNEAPSSAGTPLSQIPAQTARKRKAPVSQTTNPAYTTPTKHPNPNQQPIISPGPRVSFAPPFSQTLHNPLNHHLPAPTFKPNPVLLTPDPSPSKPQGTATRTPSHHSPLIQPTTTFPRTPTSTPKPSKRHILHISPTIQAVKTSFIVLAKHDAYTADLARRTVGFDLLRLSDEQAEVVVRRCWRVVQALVGGRVDGRRGFDGEGGVEIDVDGDA